MPPEPLVLGFDTSAAHCAAALVSGGRVLAAAHQDMPRGQGEALFPMLAMLLDKAGCGWEDLTGVGCGVGPGNFTGTRISVAAARGLALARGIPAIGVSAFETLAAGRDAPVLALVDARQGRVHGARVERGARGEPVTGELDTVLARIGGDAALCIGHRADEAARRLGCRRAPPRHEPGVAVALLAESRVGQAATPPAPLYLRPADAAPSGDPPPPLLP